MPRTACGCGGEEWIDGHSRRQARYALHEHPVLTASACGIDSTLLAGSAVDVVRSAGGWLYDRVMAGWEVTVLLPHGRDTRPLRILGVRALDLESELEGDGLDEPESGGQRRCVHRRCTRS